MNLFTGANGAEVKLEVVVFSLVDSLRDSLRRLRLRADLRETSGTAGRHQRSSGAWLPARCAHGNKQRPQHRTLRGGQGCPWGQGRVLGLIPARYGRRQGTSLKEAPSVVALVVFVALLLIINVVVISVVITIIVVLL